MAFLVEEFEIGGIEARTIQRDGLQLKEKANRRSWRMILELENILKSQTSLIHEF